MDGLNATIRAKHSLSGNGVGANTASSYGTCATFVAGALSPTPCRFPAAYLLVWLPPNDGNRVDAPT